MKIPAMMIKRLLHTTSRLHVRTPSFKAGNTGKNLSILDILGDLEQPKNNIEMISDDSIIFTNLTIIKSPNQNGHTMGSILLNNEIFESDLTKSGYKIHNKFMIELEDSDSSIFEMLRILHPKPDLLLVGLGKRSRVLHELTRQKLTSLGIQLEVSDTKHAVQSYNLLATERSPREVAALLFPPNV